MKKILVFTMLAVFAVAEIGSAQQQLRVKAVFDVSGRKLNTANLNSAGMHLVQFEGFSGSAEKTARQNIKPATIQPSLQLPSDIDSIIHFKNGNRGIGTTNPIAKLQVVTSGPMFSIMGTASEGDGGVGVGGSGDYGTYGSGIIDGAYGFSLNGRGVHGYSANGWAGYFEGKGYFSSELTVEKRLIVGDEKIDVVAFIKDLKSQIDSLKEEVAFLKNQLRTK
jgi:hypothetical protein